MTETFTKDSILVQITRADGACAPDAEHYGLHLNQAAVWYRKWDSEWKLANLSSTTVVKEVLETHTFKEAVEILSS